MRTIYNVGEGIPRRAGDLTTEQQAQMIAEASAWRARALKAEAALAAMPAPASSGVAGLVERKFIDITSTASRIAKQMGAEFVVDEQRLAAMIARELERLNQPSPPPTGSERDAG